MKLKSKDTGVIGDLVAYDADKGIFAVKVQGGDRYYYYSLATLHEVWEDAPEEPKEYWYLENNGEVVKTTYEGNLYEEKMQEIGNYFETKEEAEKAVEKLKAWKRLKDKGFRFTAWYGGSKNIDYKITSLENETYTPRQICDDLNLLFGGEE